MLQKFKKISVEFSIDKRKFFGEVIASPAALYLVMTRNRYDELAVTGGGIFGMLVAAVSAVAVVASMTNKEQAARTCRVNELPSEVLDHPQWPVSRTKHGECGVLVIPRQSVAMLDHPSFSRMIQFNGPRHVPVVIEYPIFRGASVRDYLNDAGWPVKWKGVVL